MRQFDRLSSEKVFESLSGAPITDTEIESIKRAAEHFLSKIERLSTVADQSSVSYPPRHPGRIPTEDEDPYNAIIRLCDVHVAQDGPLFDMRIGIKDHIAVAGIPMTEGRKSCITTIPTEDAVVVERLLQAGAKIVAKTNLSLTGAPYGLPKNPLNPNYFTGASSSGSAAAVAGGLVDAALGSDSGGSIRNPAAFCGIVGIKPTYGRVPLQGAGGYGSNLTQIGPMTKTVADNAAILEVISGDDIRDPSTVDKAVPPGAFSDAANAGVEGLRLGVIVESLEAAGCTNNTLKAFDDAQRVLGDLGAKVVPVSAPLWDVSSTIWWLVYIFSRVAMPPHFQRYGYTGRVDLELEALMETQRRLELKNDLFGGPIAPLIFEYLDRARLGRPFALAQNLRLDLKKQIESLFLDVDLLLTPTVKTCPPKFPDESIFRQTEPVNGSREFAFPNIPVDAMHNVVPNLTGHPALTVPAGTGDDGFPTGLQIIGRMFDEYSVYKAGFSFERSMYG